MLDHSRFFLDNVLINYAYYISIKTLLKLENDEQKRAFLLTLKDSIILTLCGILYTIGLLSTEEAQLKIIVLFQAHLVSDLLIGYFEYYPRMLGIEGVYHHIVYIVGNVLAYYRPADREVFLLYLIEEIPTFIRAFGTIKPEYRSDLAFGLTMGLFRVAFHAYMWAMYFTDTSVWVTTILSFMALCIHAHWFWAWLTKYGRTALEKSNVLKRLYVNVF